MVELCSQEKAEELEEQPVPVHIKWKQFISQ
jgi:hypothetical protein